MGSCISSTTPGTHQQEFQAMNQRIASLERRLNDYENSPEQTLAMLRLKNVEATNEAKSLENIIIELKTAREITKTATSSINQSTTMRSCIPLSAAPIIANQPAIAVVHSRWGAIELEIVKADGTTSILYTKAAPRDVGSLTGFVNSGESVRILERTVTLQKSGTEGFLCMI